jgi:hypothetical protein
VTFTFEISLAFLLTRCISPDTSLNLSSTYSLICAIASLVLVTSVSFSNLHWHIICQ